MGVGFMAPPGGPAVRGGGVGQHLEGWAGSISLEVIQMLPEEGQERPSALSEPRAFSFSR